MDVRILGEIAVSHQGDDVPLAGVRRRALLARLLIARGRVVPTDRLVEDVWGAAATPGTESSLKANVYQLRKRLGSEGHRLRAEAGGYRLTLSTSEIDAGRFETLVGRARATASIEERAAVLAEALDAWRAPVLAELGGELWAQPEVARLTALHADVAEDWADAQLALGRHGGLLAALEAAASEEPLRERRCGQLMVALYRNGRQADALRAYQDLRHRLIDELGIEPTTELTRLESAILRQDPALDAVATVRRANPPAPERAPAAGDFAPAAVPPPVVAARRSPIYGRGPQLTRARQLWASAAAGTRQVVVLSGEPGVGKTRLAAEVAADVAATGGVALWGRCDDSGVSFQPLVEALLTGLPTAMADEAAADPVLRRLLVPDPADAAGGATAVEQSVLFDATCRLTDRILRERPLLVVVDDLQWASPATVALLRYWLPRAVAAPVMLLATVRPDEVHGAPAGLLAELATDPACTELPVGDLAVSDVERLVRDVHDGDLAGDTAGTARAVHDRTHGNALLTVQLLREVAAAPPDRRAQLLVPGSAAVPVSIGHLLTQRLDRLPADTSAVLQRAAVIGTEFDVPILEAVCPGPDDVLPLLELAARARLVDEDPVSGRYRFVHALVRDAFAARLSTVRRRRLHGLVADALAASGADPAVVAHHYVAAASPELQAQAIDWLERAAWRQRARGAYQDAVHTAEETLALIGRDGPVEQRVAILLAMSLSHGVLQDLEAADAAATEAVEEARRAGAHELMVNALVVRVGYASFDRPDPEAKELLRSALRELGDGAPALRAQVLAHMAFQEAVMDGRGFGADPRAQDAVALARSSGDRDSITETVHLRAYILQGSSDIGLQQRVLDELRDHAGALATDRPTRISDAKPWLDAAILERSVLRLDGVLRLQLGDRAGFAATLDRLRQLGEERHDWLARSIADMWRAADATFEGRWSDAHRHSANLVSPVTGQADRPDMPAPSTVNRNLLHSWAALHYLLAREHGSLTSIEGLAAAAARESSQPLVRAFTALIDLDLGRLDAARTVAAQLTEEDLCANARAIGGNFVLAVLAEVWSRLGDPEHSALVEPLLAPYHGQFVVLAWGIFVFGAADRYLAMLASVQRRWDDADRLFAAALDRETAAGSPPQATRTRLCWARSLIDRGSSAGTLAEAGRLIDRAATDATAMAMTHVVAELDDARARIGGTASGHR